jgi:hypothetical protein
MKSLVGVSLKFIWHLKVQGWMIVMSNRLSNLIFFRIRIASSNSLLKKQLFVRLIKNVQMQGARNPEE